MVKTFGIYYIEGQKIDSEREKSKYRTDHRAVLAV